MQHTVAHLYYKKQVEEALRLVTSALMEDRIETPASLTAQPPDPPETPVRFNLGRRNKRVRDFPLSGTLSRSRLAPQRIKKNGVIGHRRLYRDGDSGNQGDR